MNTGFLSPGETQASSDDALLLLNRVIAAAVTSIVVTDPYLPDNPIVYHNPAFENISGYSAAEIDGHNCRFLQGPDTDSATVSELRQAIREERPCQVVLLNYQKDGTPFWNELSLSPVHDASGRLTHFVGVQSDITNRKEAEAERDALFTQQQRIADTLQRALLLVPSASTFSGLDVATQYTPAGNEAKIGGDFFDTFALTESKVALVVGDVTGKGLAAGQHTAEIKYALRVLLREDGNPDTALYRLNRFLLNAQRLDARDEDALVGICVSVIDTATGVANVAVGGMEPPLIIRANGEFVEVETEGMILGMTEEAGYCGKTITLGEDDTLIFATDGITESRNAQRDLFGYERFVQAAITARTAPSLKAMSESVVKAAIVYADGKQQDDICLLLARRMMSGAPIAIRTDPVDIP